MKKPLVVLLLLAMLLSVLSLVSCDESYYESSTEVKDITLTKSWQDLNGKPVSEVEEYFKELGFTDIELIEVSGEKGDENGCVTSVTIKEWGISSESHFSKGDVFASDHEIEIRYAKVKVEETKVNITIENNEDFAALMQISDQTDSDTIRKFVRNHIGETIEFDGCVALMVNHENYKTRFDVCIAAGDYEAEKVYGPLFAFIDVNFGNMNVSGSDTVTEGMNFHIVGVIEKYDSEGNYIQLKPISMTAR